MKFLLVLLFRINAEFDDLAKKVMAGFSCENFELKFKVRFPCNFCFEKKTMSISAIIYL